MNRQSKSAIKSLVLELRHKLEDEIEIQLKRYGYAGERWLPLERLPHIQRDDRAAIDHFRLKAALEQHLRRIGADPENAKPAQRAEATDWFVRAVAFTHLNRLAALKCLEVRGLIPEIITTRPTYGDRSRTHYDYRNAHPDEARRPDDALPAAIRGACQEVYAEFRFLFDVGDPATGREPPVHSILWPSYPVLKECITLINDLDNKASTTAQSSQGTQDTEYETSRSIPSVEGRNTLWSEDEIIGWIYQFYNAEHKEAVRSRGRPRRPAEVAVINQFFTPRWIVKFLVDNTLGRLWLEMHPDSERVRRKCDYLVPEPLPTSDLSTQHRKAPGVSRDESRDTFALDPDSPINDPTAPARREPKPVTEVRLIDPACGTMHFGHYAFEVFYEMYLDALEHGWPTSTSPNPQSPIPNHEIPALILRHNLYGVDIDLRAVQLAGLSLFIKAKHALSQIEGSANPRAHISQVNLVVADAVLPADGARAQFLDGYRDDRVIQDAVRQVLDEMANVAEVGSLLRVEERLRGILTEAGHVAVRDLDETRQDMLPGVGGPPQQLSLAEAAGAVPEDWGAHYTLNRLLEDVRAYANRALQTHDLNAQLFAQEAAKTVHLLDVFLNDYDVVVMNPPYGFTTGTAKALLRTSFPATNNDLYAAFMERACDLAKSGFVGALVPRTFMYMRTFSPVREHILMGRDNLISIIEFGLGTLDDATVRPAGVVYRSENGTRQYDQAVFFGLASVDVESKNHVFRNALDKLWRGTLGDNAFIHSLSRFRSLPSFSIAYWASKSLLSYFENGVPLDSSNALWKSRDKQIAMVRRGLGTGQDSRFVRYFWEVPGEKIGKDWPFFAKGGRLSPYYRDFELVVDWRNEGTVLRSFPKSYLRSEHLYFSEGLTYTLESEKDSLGAYHLRSNCIMGDKGPGIFSLDKDMLWSLLGILNSKAVAAFIRTMTPDRTRTVGFVSSLPLPSKISSRFADVIATYSKSLWQLKKAWDTGNELCTRFDSPWLLQAHRGALFADYPDLDPTAEPPNDLVPLLDHVLAVERAADARLRALQAEIDEAVYDLYDISTEDRVLIERKLGNRPPELAWPQMERKPEAGKRCEHVRRLLSYCLLQALDSKRDGVLPVAPGTGEATALDEVRRQLEDFFGEAAAFQMEGQIRQVLGRDIGTWLDRDFFKWHVKLYRRRPIVWHLASSGGHFACFLHYRKLDRDTLRKVQTLYLWPRRRAAESELTSAKQDNAPGRIEAAETVLDDLAAFEERLLSVIEARVACEIPKWAEGPFRGGAYDPVLDDGVKVNLTPLQEAGVLRVKKVV